MKNVICSLSLLLVLVFVVNGCGGTSSLSEKNQGLADLANFLQEEIDEKAINNQELSMIAGLLSPVRIYELGAYLIITRTVSIPFIVDTTEQINALFDNTGEIKVDEIKIIFKRNGKTCPYENGIYSIHPPDQEEYGEIEEVRIRVSPQIMPYVEKISYMEFRVNPYLEFFNFSSREDVPDSVKIIGYEGMRLSEMGPVSQKEFATIFIKAVAAAKKFFRERK